MKQELWNPVWMQMQMVLLFIVHICHTVSQLRLFSIVLHKKMLMAMKV